jgi:hypothetical protein
MRGDEKAHQVESSSSGRFRARANRSHPEGVELLLRTSTGRKALAVRGDRVCRTKGAERRDKVSIRFRGGHEAVAGPVKTFQNAGDVKNGTAGL